MSFVKTYLSPHDHTVKPKSLNPNVIGELKVCVDRRGTTSFNSLGHQPRLDSRSRITDLCLLNFFKRPGARDHLKSTIIEDPFCPSVSFRHINMCCHLLFLSSKICPQRNIISKNEEVGKVGLRLRYSQTHCSSCESVRPKVTRNVTCTVTCNVTCNSRLRVQQLIH